MIRMRIHMVLMGCLAMALLAPFAAAQDRPAEIPAPTQPPEAAAPAAPDYTVLNDEPVSYILREGDTFESIAEKWYGNKELWTVIAEANPKIDPKSIVVGATILLSRIDLGDQAAKIAPLPEGEIKILQAVIMNVEGKRAQWRTISDPAWKNAAVNDILSTGAEVRTGSDSTITLRIGMNASMLIDRTSRIVLPEMIQAGDVLRTRVTMQYGLADVKVDHVGLANDFEIKTPSATLAVKGTGWRLVWDAIDGFQAFGVPTNRIRAIEIAYLNAIKVALSADDASSDGHQLPSLEAFAQTYFLPLVGAVSPEDVEFLTMVVTHGNNLLQDLGLDEAFGHQGFNDTIQEIVEQHGRGEGGCGCGNGFGNGNGSGSPGN